MFHKRAGMLFLMAVISVLLTACNYFAVRAAVDALGSPQGPDSGNQLPPSGGAGAPVEEGSPQGPGQTDLSPLALFWAEDGDSAWRDGSLLCTAGWDRLYLSREDAAAYPALAAALEAMNQEAAASGSARMAELEAIAEGTVPGGETNGLCAGFRQKNEVQRADGTVLSVLHFAEEYSAVQSSSTVWVTNLDPATGRELTLADVFVDPNVLPDLLEKQCETGRQPSGANIREHFASCIAREEFFWVAGYQNVTFYFPSFSGSGDALSVCLWFQDDPGLFREPFRACPEQYAVRLTPGRPIQIDLDSRDGRKDSIRYEAGPDRVEFLVNGESYCLVPDGEITESSAYYTYELYLVHLADGNHVLYMDMTMLDDYHILSVYSLDDMLLLDRLWSVGFYEEFTEDGERRRALFTDPARFTLYTWMELLGSMWGICEYAADPISGLPLAQKPYFDVINDNTLTALVPLNAIALPDEKQETLPAGTQLFFVRTDCLSYVDLRADDGREWRIFVDTSEWPVTVNGFPADECFGGILYTG